MKSIKKIVSLSLASAMILSASTSIFAATGDYYVKETQTKYSASSLRNKDIRSQLMKDAKNANYTVLYEISSGRLVGYNAAKGLVATEAAKGKDGAEIMNAIKNNNDIVVNEDVSGYKEVTAQRDFKVQSVSDISRTGVEVTFPALSETKTVNVVVKDNNGNVIATKATEVLKGSTSAQFDFVTPFPGNYEFKGVWTVDGVEYSFTALEQVEDINDAATAGNQVTLLQALNAAGIKNVDSKLIGTYLTDIAAASPQAVTIADVQKIVDDANEDAVKTADVKAVQDAKTQIAVYNALNSNFVRVNSAWANLYAAGSTTNPTSVGVEITAANTPNNIVDTADGGNTSTTTTTPTGVQAAVDAVNAKAIAAADSAATTAADQAKVTALIQKWVKEDVGSSKVKANMIKASQIQEAVYKVEEATTQNTVYNALVNLSNLDSNTGKLNAKLAPFYFAEQQTATLNGTVAKINSDVIAAANAEAKEKALDDVVAAYQAINTAEAGTGATAAQTAALRTALNKLNDYTNHTADKLDMSKIKDENLVKYAKVFAQVTAIDNTSTVSAVMAKINKVNDADVTETALEVINNKNATVAQVRDALVEIALERNTGSSATNAAEFINLSTQAKNEVAEFVVEARPAAGYSNKNAIISTVDGSGALKTAVDAQATKVGEFNAIGDLASSSVTTTTIKSALDTYANDSYMALSGSEKVKVATVIGNLNKPVGNPAVATPLNFLGADAVKTMKEADAIIAAAIAAPTPMNLVD